MAISMKDEHVAILDAALSGDAWVVAKIEHGLVWLSFEDGEGNAVAVSDDPLLFTGTIRIPSTAKRLIDTGILTLSS